MSDLKTLKEKFDLREWVERDLGQSPKYRNSGDKAWNFKCPFHNEQKGTSLAVYRTYWKCFGACGASGDILDWIARRKGLTLDQGKDFREIIRILGGDLDTLSTKNVKRSTLSKSLTPVTALPPNDQWQVVATELVERAEHYLWSNGGREALHYLVYQRGLHEETIRAARLGYIPYGGRQPRVEQGMKIPSHSITIPWFAENALWGVKCRLLSGGDLRYLFFTADDDHKKMMGSANINGSLYWVDHVMPRTPILVVEGEFNCLSAWEAAGDLVCPVSLGTSGQALNVRWFASLLTAPLILAWFDADRAGQGGVTRLAGLAHYIQQLTLPGGMGKDLNDFWCTSQTQGDPDAMRRWLRPFLESYPK